MAQNQHQAGIPNGVHYGHPLLTGAHTDEYGDALAAGDTVSLPQEAVAVLTANIATLLDEALTGAGITLAEYVNTRLDPDDVWTTLPSHQRWATEGITHGEFARRSLADKIGVRWTTTELIEHADQRDNSGHGDTTQLSAYLGETAARLNASPEGPWYFVADPHFFLEDAGLVVLVHAERPGTIAAWYTCAGTDF